MAQAMRTAAPGEVFDRQVHAERRRFARSPETHARRRHGQVRPSYLHTERRRAPSTSFDVAAALELNLDWFPTRTGMLMLLRTWLYAAECEGLNERRVAVCLRPPGRHQRDGRRAQSGTCHRFAERGNRWREGYWNDHSS